MTVVTRFAPSPTGYLHIGSARTALFNWLFAKHHKGKFFLRVEDTDRSRSTEEATAAIFNSLQWLGLDWDGEPVHQSNLLERHAEVAHELLEEGKAYYCYCTPAELEQMREEAKAKGLPPKYDGRWRNRDPKDGPIDVAPVIRFKAPQEGETVIEDSVQGTVRLQNTHLDDMILLRADGTPTYMLSVVVDDHDMGITHIIRGDDHLTNAFRQAHLYTACGWDVPQFAHIPLIHGQDGAKLSKRHGALGAEHYRDLGFLPEAMRNYLLRLGWSHGDDEIISTDQAIEWFNLESIGRSPARLDLIKLANLNSHYLREADDQRLTDLVIPGIESLFVRAITPQEKERILKGMPGLKQRAKTILELVEGAKIYVRVSEFDEKSEKFVTKESAKIIQPVAESLEQLTEFTEETIESAIRAVAESIGEKLGNVAQPLRVALSGRTVSPSIFEMMAVLGKEETLSRLGQFIQISGW